MISKQSWPKESGQSFVAKLIIYFFYPFLAWVYSLKEPNKKSSYLIFFLFSILLCWHMAPAGISTGYDDFLGILSRFEDTQISTGKFLNQVSTFLSGSDDAPKELYDNFLIWIVKSFTNNYHFFFLLAGIPIALMQLKSLRLITSDEHFVCNFYGFLAVLMMILPRDIITAQNPRFSTGFWLFVCCSLYCFTGDKIKIKYILPLFLLPVIHSGLWPALIFTCVFIILPKKNVSLYEHLALFSIPFMFFDINLMSYFNFSILPDNIVGWAERYSSEEYYARYILNEGKSGFYWVEEIFTLGRKIVYLIMALQVIQSGKKNELGKEANNFYPFFLMTFFTINMIQFVPVLGMRYSWMWQVFVFYAWYKTFHFSKKKLYILLLFFSSWYILKRYGYFLGGALAVNTPPDIFLTPLPYLMGKGIWW